MALLIWILAIWVSYHYSQLLEPWLKQYIHDKTLLSIAAFVLMMVAILVAGSIVNVLLSYVLKLSGLGGTDRLLGMGFGFIRGVFIVALIMAVVKLTAMPVSDYTRQSKLYDRFDPIVSWLCGFMPGLIDQAKALDKITT